MKKLILLAVVALVMFATPVFAQVEFSDESAKYGIIKEIQIQNAGASESAGKGIIDVTNLAITATESVWTIAGTTGDSTASISTETSTATATKAGALKITYTGITGAATTGWLRVYSTDK